MLHGCPHQFHRQREQVVGMHAEVVTRATAVRKGRRLQQKESDLCAAFRIAQLFIRRTNSAELLGLAFRWTLAHQLKIGAFDLRFTGLTVEAQNAVGITHWLRDGVRTHAKSSSSISSNNSSKRRRPRRPPVGAS